jgi:small-conductance mechanosensitive channel
MTTVRRALLASLVFLCTAASPTPAPTAIVELDRHPVIEIHWGFKTLTAEDRARRISTLLVQIADAPPVPTGFAATPSGPTVDITYGKQLVASVYAGDAEAEHETQEELGAQWASAFTSGVSQYRDDHSLSQRISRLALTLLTLAIVVLALVTFGRIQGSLSRRLRDAVQKRTEGRSQLVAFLEEYHLVALMDALLGITRLVLSLAVLYAGLQIGLSLFPSTRPLADATSSALAAFLVNFGQSFLKQLPGLLFVAIVFVVAYYVVRILRFLSDRVAAGTITIAGFKPQWASTTQWLLAVAVVILALLIAFPYIPGSKSPAFQGISIFVGVLVSLGSSALVANALAGIMLTYIGAFEPGDRVKVGDVDGEVIKLGLLTTRFRTRLDQIITLANANVLGQQITNFDADPPKGSVVTSRVGIGYDTPWRQVEAMMQLAATRTGGLAADPAPEVLTLSLNSFDVTYELVVHLAPGAVWFAVQSALNRNVLDAFNEFNVQIMTPAYVADSPDLKVVRPANWYDAPAKKTE